MILLQTFNFCLFFFSLYLGLGIYTYSPGCLRVLLIMSLLFREQVKLKDRMLLGEKNLSVLNHLGSAVPEGDGGVNSSNNNSSSRSRDWKWRLKRSQRGDLGGTPTLKHLSLR